MKALILNSGLGRRMGEYQRHGPKCLLKIHGEETILSRQVHFLLQHDIQEIVITTGPFASMIAAYLEQHFPGGHFRYVHNPCYESTNYIYSIYLAQKEIEGSLLLLHGDLVFDPSLLTKTIESEAENTVLVHAAGELPAKDFTAQILDGRVQRISLHLSGADCFPLMPLYRLSDRMMKKWLIEIKIFQERGDLGCYAEDALNKILPQETLSPLYFGEEFCQEIDNVHDLQRVREAFLHKGEKG